MAVGNCVISVPTTRLRSCWMWTRMRVSSRSSRIDVEEMKPQQAILQRLGEAPRADAIRLLSLQSAHRCRIRQRKREATLQHVPEGNPRGRRSRTELPRCWLPSAAQTWCAVSRHAFMKALSAMQSKESVSPVVLVHTRTACASAVASNRS